MAPSDLNRYYWRRIVNPFAKQQKEYLKVKIQTASKEQLVLMLMDGVLRFSEQGRTAIENKDIEKKQFSLVRTQDIIIELISGLNHELGGEISANLSRLYTYAIRKLVDANMTNNLSAIDEVQNIFRNLREAWAIAMDKVNKDKAATEPAPELSSFRKDRTEPAMAGAGASLNLSGIKTNFAGSPATTSTPAAGTAGNGLRSLGSLGAFVAKKQDGERPRLSIQG